MPRSAKRKVRPVRPAQSMMEHMEQRLLLAVNPVISEFMADNEGFYESPALVALNDDAIDTSPDWIEIYNPNAASIELSDYYLTDDPADLTKWRFPTRPLGPHQYAIVFASSEVVDSTTEMHANFRLSNAGGYLALSGQDNEGEIVPLSEYDPYPTQIANVSYGMTASANSDMLVGPSSVARVLVPTDASVDDVWRYLGFDDLGWASGRSGFGYEAGSFGTTRPGGFTVRMVDIGAPTIDNIAEAQDILDGQVSPGSYAVVSDTSKDYASIVLGDGRLGLPTPDKLPNGFGGGTADSGVHQRTDYALRIVADVRFTTAGQYTINVNSDDGFELNIPGVTFTSRTNNVSTGSRWQGTAQPDSVLVYGGARGAANTYGTFTVPTAGFQTRLTLDYFERGGGDSIDLSIASGEQTYRLRNFQLLADGVLGIQVKTAASADLTDYRSLINTNLQAEMYGLRTSAYIRIPFGVDQPSDYDVLALRMKYDDGFIAYVNGVKVWEENPPTSAPTWTSDAGGGHDDGLAVVFQEYELDLSSVPLQSGTNILAIHALNDSASSSDFLIVPELAGLELLISEPRYFQEPTPYEQNNTSDITGVVADTKFSQDRGVYSGPFDLTISCATPGAVIRYTTDGTEPTATHGTIYDPMDPEPANRVIRIDRTTTLRAAAFKEGYVSSNVDTQTYLFLADVMNQQEGVVPAGFPSSLGALTPANYGMDPGILMTDYSAVLSGLRALPSISIVMNAADLFDSGTGIYANPQGDGKEWERKASIELIQEDPSKEGFQIDAGIRIRGGYSRQTSNPKHGFRLFFRDEYGDGKLDFPMFGEDGAQSYDSFDLRTFQNYSWSFDPGSGNGVFLRDQLSRDLQLAMSHPSERGDYYHLYINGHYWGIFNSCERPEADYGESYFGGDEEDYDVIKIGGAGDYNVYATDGDTNAWRDLWDRARAIYTAGKAGQDTTTAYMRLLGCNADGTRNPAYPVLLDVDNLIDYMLVIYYGGNLDAPLSNFLSNWQPNNFFALRNRNGEEGFRFFIHDAEHTLLNVYEDRTGPYVNNIPTNTSTAFAKSNPQWLLELLSVNPEFKLRVADRIHKHFHNHGVLSTSTTNKNAVRQLFARRAAELNLAVYAESARWGDSKRSPSLTHANWQSEIDRIATSYLPYRSDIVFAQLSNDGYWPKVTGSGQPLDAPVPNLNSGVIDINTYLALFNPAPANGGTVYYTTDGSDPRLLGGGISTTASTYTAPFRLSNSATVKSRIRLPNGQWSALTEATYTFDLSKFRVTEIMYNPEPPSEESPYVAEDFQYIELSNLGGTAIQLGGLAFTDGIEFTFEAVSIGPNERRLIVKNKAAFLTRYPGVSEDLILRNAATGSYSFAKSLATGGEDIEISREVDGTVTPLLRFEYNDWYDHTDGEGWSIVAVNPLAPESILSSKSGWRPSRDKGGDPGALVADYAPNTIVINEILSHANIDPPGDWIEFYNSSNENIDLYGWFLSDTDTDLTRFRIPQHQIVPAKGYLVLNQAVHFGSHLGGFGLSELGEQLLLSGPDSAGNLGGYRDSVDFGAADPEITFGRYVKIDGSSDFVALQSPTPRSSNAPAAIGPVVIHEINYHPLSSELEYLELKNLSAADILLADGYMNWTLTQKANNEVYTYEFMAGSTIPAFGYALVVGTDPAAFRARYAIPDRVPIFGPWTPIVALDGNELLDNGKADLKLYKPGLPELDGSVPPILVDRVDYDDAAPWPTTPDGFGASLARRTSGSYGNDAAFWMAAGNFGTPGAPNVQEAPVVDAGFDRSIPFGEALVQAGSFKDWNLGQTWLVTVDWGDGVVEPLSPNADQSFDLVHSFGKPGVYRVRVTVVDSGGGQGSDSMDVTVLPSSLSGQWLLKLDEAGNQVQFHEDGSAEASFVIPRGLLESFTFGGEGDDRLVLDLSAGNPLPQAGLNFVGGGNDSLELINLPAGQEAVFSGDSVDFGSGATGIGWAEALAVRGLGLVRGNLPAGAGRVLRLEGVSIEGLDLSDNPLIIDAGSYGDVAALVRSGKVFSSQSRAERRLGVAVAGDLNLEEFAGQAVGPDSILVKYTWSADTNFDGQVTTADFAELSKGYVAYQLNKTNPLYQSRFTSGDFDLDGVVGTSDFALLSKAYVQSQVEKSQGGSGMAATLQTEAKTAQPKRASAKRVRIRHHRAPRGRLLR